MKERAITSAWLLCVVIACVWFKFLLIPSILICYLMVWEIATNGKIANYWAVVATLQTLGIFWVNQMTQKEIIFIAIVIVLNDTMAYFGGKYVNLGFKKQLFPKISPKKTIAGLVYGLVFATIGAMLFNYFIPIYGMTKSALLGFILALFGVAGDFVESKFKRVNGIKDSGQNMWTGRLLKGHGGFFDRFDAISMALWGFWLWKILSTLSGTMKMVGVLIIIVVAKVLLGAGIIACLWAVFILFKKIRKEWK